MVGEYRPRSTTPACSQARICSLAGNVPIRFSRKAWSILSNADFRSASRTQSRFAFLPARARWIISIAS